MEKIGLELRSHEKSTVEQHQFLFSYGNHVTMTISYDGDFTCTGDYGNYNYSWCSFGDDFISFLKGLDSGYLYGKLCKKDYFDFFHWQKKAFNDIISMRKSNELNREDARITYDFIKELDPVDSCDVVAIKLWESRELSDIYEEIHYAEFFPSPEYSPRQIQFIEEIYPQIVGVL